MQINPINPKYAKALTALYKADRRYVESVDRDEDYLNNTEFSCDHKYHAAKDRIEAKQFDRYDSLVERFIERAELPKRELAAFSKAYESFHGYTPYLV